MPIIETFTPTEASDYLRQYGLNLSAEHIRYGVQQGTFPFGSHVLIKQHEYVIYKKLLDEWIVDRAISK